VERSFGVIHRFILILALLIGINACGIKGDPLPVNKEVPCLICD